MKRRAKETTVINNSQEEKCPIETRKIFRFILSKSEYRYYLSCQPGLLKITDIKAHSEQTASNGDMRASLLFDWVRNKEVMSLRIDGNY